MIEGTLARLAAIAPKAITTLLGGSCGSRGCGGGGRVFVVIVIVVIVIVRLESIGRKVLAFLIFFKVFTMAAQVKNPLRVNSK